METHEQRLAHRVDTFRHFAMQRAVSDNPKIDNRIAVEAHNRIHDELRKLKPMHDGEFVFRAWADQWPDAKNRKEIGMAMDPTERFFPEGITYASERECMEAAGEQSGLYVATSLYFATGEGNTVQILAKSAQSLAHFILAVGEEVGGHYFVQGMDFYYGIPEGDRLFDNYVSQVARDTFFVNDGHVDINLNFHVNYS